MAPASTAGPLIGDTRLKDELLRSESEKRRRQALSDADKAAEDEAHAARTGVTHVDLDTGFSPLPESGDNADPKSEMVVVRFRREVEEMSYGRQVITPPVYDDRGNVVTSAVLGNIRYFSFTEGRRYEIPRAMAEHLWARGIVYDYE